MDDDRWLTREQLRAWTRFVAVVELLPGTLDSQLQQDSGLSHFEYFTLAMLSEAPGHTLRMSALAVQTNATLPRLSHVVARLETRGLVERTRAADDRRATDAVLTPAGWEKVLDSAPGHVENVRRTVIDPLDAADVAALDRISQKMLVRLDPEGRFGSHPA